MSEQVSPLEAITFDRLVVIHHNEPVNHYLLNKSPMIVGRGSDCDIVINHRSISREHIQIDRDEDSGEYLITDLNTTNGTYLNNTRISPKAKIVWHSEDVVRTGDLLLRIEPNIVEDDVESFDTGNLNEENDPRQHFDFPALNTDGDGMNAPPPAQITRAVDALLIPEAIMLDPGSSGNLMLEIINHSPEPDNFSVVSPDLPPAWASIPAHSIRVNGNDNQMVSIPVHPPRSSNSSAGTRPFLLRIQSLNHHDVVTDVRGQIQLSGFQDFALSLEPGRIRNGKLTRLRIHNTGNVASVFRITASAPDAPLRFEYPPETMTILPGQTQDIPVRVTAVNQAFLGEQRVHSFELSVSIDDINLIQFQPGTVSVPPVVSSLTIGIFGVILMSLCTLTLILAAGINGVLLPQLASETATATAVTATHIAEITEQLTIEAEQTLIALTATAGADIDEDGLLTFEELEAGTEPRNSDTDGDGLSDGDEVNGETNALMRDTDGDGLNDGEDPFPLIPFSPTTPEETIQQYYALVQERQYDISYTWLTDNYKSANSPTRTIYDEWWNSVAAVTIGEITVISQTDELACLYVYLTYQTTDGSFVVDNQPYFILANDPATGGWQIDSKATYTEFYYGGH